MSYEIKQIAVNWSVIAARDAIWNGWYPNTAESIIDENGMVNVKPIDTVIGFNRRTDWASNMSDSTDPTKLFAMIPEITRVDVGRMNGSISVR